MQVCVFSRLYTTCTSGIYPQEQTCQVKVWHQRGTISLGRGDPLPLPPPQTPHAPLPHPEPQATCSGAGPIAIGVGLCPDRQFTNPHPAPLSFQLGTHSHTSQHALSRACGVGHHCKVAGCNLPHQGRGAAHRICAGGLAGGHTGVGAIHHGKGGGDCRVRGLDNLDLCSSSSSSRVSRVDGTFAAIDGGRRATVGVSLLSECSPPVAVAP